jgi:hypothetical protein
MGGRGAGNGKAAAAAIQRRPALTLAGCRWQSWGQGAEDVSFRHWGNLLLLGGAAARRSFLRAGKRGILPARQAPLKQPQMTALPRQGAPRL